jgi:hypothetical protein
MKTLPLFALLGLLTVGVEAKAQTPTLPGAPRAAATETVDSTSLPPGLTLAPEGQFAGTGAGTGTRFWAEADTLLWWMKGPNLPPLVTTSPAGTPIGQAGVLGSNGTTVLFGNSTVNEDARIGGRVTAGWWFDKEDTTFGVEGSFFRLEGKAANFLASSNGNPILARPFIDAVSGGQSSQRVAFPGDLAGTVGVSDATSGLLGAGVLLRERLCCGCNYTLDILAGYRYLTFSDNLSISENLINTNPNNPNFIPQGANILVGDRFGAKNQLNALDVGLTGEFHRGPWEMMVRGKVAVGYNHQAVDISGGTEVLFAPAAPSANVGGLLAQTTNIGHHSRDEISVVPELDVQLGYRLTPSVTVSVGYSYLNWSNVVRGANQIDQVVNPNLIPPAVNPGTGPNRPAFAFQRTDLWAQGLSLGLAFRY